MFGNIGAPELLIILLIALILLGPSRLPDLANALGKSIREFRKAASDVEDAAKGTPTAPAQPSASREDASPKPGPATGPTDSPSGSDA